MRISDWSSDVCSSDLARLAAIPEAAARSALARVRAEPGYERALAAALGDDLDAAVGERDAVRVWMGAAHEADPTLPQGVESLAARVTAPPALARRLAPVGVAETADRKAVVAGKSV